MKVRKKLLSGFNHSKFLYTFVALTVIAGSLIYGKISADDTSVNIAVNASMQESQESKMKSIVINEVCSRSYSDIYDILGEKYDYIELYNMGNDSVILSDLYLSDDKTDLWKCGIYTGIIPANGYYTIFASAETTNRLSVKSNLNFKISAGETIYLSYKGKVIDSVTLPEMDFRQVYARSVDGSGDFKVSSGSPNNSNNGVEFVSQPTFSVESGFYDESFTLEIKAGNGCEIYYTLDSSEPTADSIKYERPLTIADASPNENFYSALTNISAPNYPHTPPDFPIDKATIVRAVAVDKQGNISAVSTSSYFVGFQNKEGYNNISVLSFVADPDDLFGEEKGIYITGEEYDEAAAEIIEKFNAQTEPEYDENGNEITLSNLLLGIHFTLANYSLRGRDTERIVAVDVYTETKDLSASLTCGIRILGNVSPQRPKKSLRLYSRKMYDNYGVLPSELLDNDFIYEQWLMLAPAEIFRKSFPNNLVADRAISTQDYKLFQLFINGEYWGTYNVMERYTTEYIAKHYGVNEDNITVTSGTGIRNDNASVPWNEPHNYAEKYDLSDPIHYEKISEMMDIQSFIDWMCTAVYTTNGDTSERNNLHMWRSVEASLESPYADGKWRWMLYDTDVSMYMSYTIDAFTEKLSYWIANSLIDGTLFSNLIKNESFVRQFVLSFMDMANYNFNAERVLPMIDEVYSVYSAASALDRERWVSSLNFESQVRQAREFFTNRYDYAVQHLADNFNLTGALATITLATPDINAGDITLNTITPEMSEGVWSGKYYTDYPVTVTANPKPGYKFVGWELRGGTTDNLLTDSTISVSFSGDNAITAVFEAI